MVAVDGALSNKAPVKSGVPQGTVLGPLLFIIYIGDVDRLIKHAYLSSFADDTRLMMKVRHQQDVAKLQEDLRCVYDWATVNSMTLNSSKFQHLRYSGGLEMELSCYCDPDGNQIQISDQVKDLGVIMSSSGKFEDQIEAVVSKSRQTCGWILRVFRSRQREVMLQLFKSMVLPIVEYCCLLWSPLSLGLIRKVESVQRSFTNKIDDMREIDYWERLKALNLYSLERRRDRYFIFYIWKIVNGLVPNIECEGEGISTTHSLRRGTLCNIPPINTRCRASVQTMKECSIVVHGCRLFNAVPRELREFRGSSETFKRKLDTFLSSVPDKPALVNYHQPSAGNGLLSQLAQLRAEPQP